MYRKIKYLDRKFSERNSNMSSTTCYWAATIPVQYTRKPLVQKFIELSQEAWFDDNGNICFSVQTNDSSWSNEDHIFGSPNYNHVENIPALRGIYLSLVRSNAVCLIYCGEFCSGGNDDWSSTTAQELIDRLLGSSHPGLEYVPTLALMEVIASRQENGETAKTPVVTSRPPQRGGY